MSMTSSQVQRTFVEGVSDACVFVVCMCEWNEEGSGEEIIVFLSKQELWVRSYEKREVRGVGLNIEVYKRGKKTENKNPKKSCYISLNSQSLWDQAGWCYMFLNLGLLRLRKRSETKVLLIYEEMHQAEADPYIHFRCFSLIITSLRASELFIKYE